VTNKLDAASTVILRYKYDPNDRLTVANFFGVVKIAELAP